MESNERTQLPLEDSLEKILTLTDEQKQNSTSIRKTPTLKYNAKTSNTDQKQHAKTVDIVRLKTGIYKMITDSFNIASSSSFSPLIYLLFSHLSNHSSRSYITINSLTNA